MPRRDGLSVREKLVLAAHLLEQDGHRPFTAEDLVVAAWTRFPATFGLRGYQDDDGKPKYPDSNRVFAEIMGSKPMRKLGLMAKVGEKMYELTETGRDLAEQIKMSVSNTSGSIDTEAKACLSRDVQRKLQQLLSSRAVQKVRSGETEALTFHDACVFWGITPQSSAMELSTRLEVTIGMIRVARRSLRDGTARFHHRGDILSSDMLDSVEQTHGTLKSTFKTELDTIKKRTDERRR